MALVLNQRRLSLSGNAHLENEASAPGYHADGLEPNRHTMDLFCDMGFALGLTPKLISVDDYFAEYLESI